MADEEWWSSIENQLNEKYEKTGYLPLAELYDYLGFEVSPDSDVWCYAYIKGKGLCLLTSEIVDLDCSIMKIPSYAEIASVDFE